MCVYVTDRLYGQGAVKGTNEIRELLQHISRDHVPVSWTAEFRSPAFVTLTAWMSDLLTCLKNLSQYKAILSSGESETRYWIGGMFAPESFITALRQHSAQVSERIVSE